MNQTSARTGILLSQPSGYSAFSPGMLIPIPQLAWDDELSGLLAEAGLGVGRLDGLSRALPNPDLFISIFVRQEAVLSSQIEGTQCTLEDVLNFPVQPEKSKGKDVQSVINYVEAMNYGLQRLNEENGLPLSVRLLREIHTVLMEGARGQNRAPGEVRKSQNWIGPAGSTIMTASYVPPPVPEMHAALTDLEKFLHVRSGIAPLVQIALAHAQFESIHPFLDGNGRLGRLLITLFLCERKLLKRPLLYLSHFLKSNQYEYYRRLTAIREDGDWEGWIKFFLNGIRIVSGQAVRNAELLLELRDEHRARIENKVGTTQALRLLDYLCDQPIVTVQMVSDHLNCAYVTAQRLIDEFLSAELLVESTGQKRNRKYEYTPYLRFWRTAQDDVGALQIEPIVSAVQLPVNLEQGKLSVAKLPRDRKLVILQNEKDDELGAKIMINTEVHVLLNELEISPAVDLDRSNITTLPVNISATALDTLTKFATSDRDLELASKEAICELFYTLRDVLGKKTTGIVSWEDSSDGSFLVFYCDGVRYMIDIKLDEIRNFVLKDAVQGNVQDRIATELKSLPMAPLLQTSHVSVASSLIGQSVINQTRDYTCHHCGSLSGVTITADDINSQEWTCSKCLGKMDVTKFGPERQQIMRGRHGPLRNLNGGQWCCLRQKTTAETPAAKLDEGQRLKIKFSALASGQMNRMPDYLSVEVHDILNSMASKPRTNDTKTGTAGVYPVVPYDCVLVYEINNGDLLVNGFTDLKNEQWHLTELQHQNTSTHELEYQTIQCLNKIIENGGQVIISKGLQGIAASYRSGNESVMYGEEEFEYAVQKGWLDRLVDRKNQVKFLITPRGRVAAGQDLRDLTNKSVRCLSKLVNNGGMVSITKGLSQLVARYRVGNEPVFYGDEEFEFAHYKGWVNMQRTSEGTIEYWITPIGRVVVDNSVFETR